MTPTDTRTAPARRPTSRALGSAETARHRVVAGALRPGPVGAVGLELEAHLVDLSDVGSRVGWSRLQDALAGLPALPGRSLVTLEPGGQVELSGPPYPGVADAVAALRADADVVAHQLGTAGLGLAVLGADPVRAPQRVNPGQRYAAMEAYFAATGNGAAGAAMMTSTASLQVNLEAGPRAGWPARVSLAHQLGPVLVAVSACSPLLTGHETGWRSSRQRVWGELDRARCGPLLGGDEPAEEWAAYALTAPVMLVRDPVTEAADPVLGGVPFGAWANGEILLGGRAATAADLDYHLTTLFPPVRLRGFLEIRYLDAAPEPWWPALAAVTATLLDDPVAAAVAAEATAGVAREWTVAARVGLAEPRLHAAAVACLVVAAARAPRPLRAEVEALASLVAEGGCPGDALVAGARRGGPAALLRQVADHG